MATKNESITVKNVVFMFSEFFCLIENDSYELEKAIARYLNVPKEQENAFCFHVCRAEIGLFLDNSLRDKIITREIVVQSFEKHLKEFDISPKEVVEAMENADFYSYNKKENLIGILSTVKYLHEKGYKLILRDDKPDGFLIEILKQIRIRKYFQSVQGLIGNYLTFSVESMKDLIGENDPKEYLIVASDIGKTSIINSAEEVGIPIIVLKDYDITELKKLL